MSQTSPALQGPYLWYAAFGSNLSWARFDAYLKGGSPALASPSLEPGARDPSDPIAESTITVGNSLYFAGAAKKWHGGGVAFLSPRNVGSSTICRLYKITVEQFEDVQMAETKQSKPKALDIELLENAGSILQYQNLYGLALRLGTHDDGCPIVTITSPRTGMSPNCPSLGYATTIVRGLLECTTMTPDEAIDYLLSKRGVDSHLDRNEIANNL